MFILFKKKRKKQIKHHETDELSAYFADSALTRHIHTTEICDMGPLRKRKMCVHVEKKWKYCFEGGKVEMLPQAKQLPQLLSEMPRVDTVWLQNTKTARTKHFIETVARSLRLHPSFI